MKKHITVFSFLLILFPVQTIISLFTIITAVKIIKKIENKNEPTDEFYDYVEDNVPDIVTQLNQEER